MGDPCRYLVKGFTVNALGDVQPAVPSDTGGIDLHPIGVVVVAVGTALMVSSTLIYRSRHGGMLGSPFADLPAWTVLACFFSGFALVLGAAVLASDDE